MLSKEPIAIVRPAAQRPARKTKDIWWNHLKIFKRSQLFNVIAVLADQKPIHRVNARRMSKALADKKVAQLLADGAIRAYAVRA